MKYVPTVYTGETIWLKMTLNTHFVFLFQCFMKPNDSFILNLRFLQGLEISVLRSSDDWWYWDQANKITKYSEFKSDLEDV